VRKIPIIFNQDTQGLVRDSKQGLPEYKSITLPLDQPARIFLSLFFFIFAKISKISLAATKAT
jgi:hypothetical protein